MRTLLFIFLLALCAGCNSSKNATGTNKLNGTWVPVSEEMAGNMLPPAAFDKQSLVIHDSTYIFTAESVDKGVVQYHDDKMDIYGKEGVNKGRHLTAIYKYENEQLTICYNLKGDSYPAGYETKSKRLLFLCVFKKEIKK